MTITIRPGIYLEQNSPAQKQWGRRSGEPYSITVVHTSEGTYRGSLNWIRIRRDFGSYHTLGCPSEITQLVDFDKAAYHCRGFNSRSTGISLAMDAEDWPALARSDVDLWVESAATMALMVAKWHHGKGRAIPAARLLTKAEAEQGVPGHISHARLDPGRRTDPGADFPWDRFFARYAALCVAEGLPDPSTTNNGETAMPKPDSDLTKFIQGYWNDHPDHYQLEVDGDWGPMTDRAIDKGWLASSLMAENEARTEAERKLADVEPLSRGQQAFLDIGVKFSELVRAAGEAS